ncbi:zinc finger protein 185 [Heteronotia binoei]|uniref:zinc finger protein 185 n=1 Tax=Heteronotia binoei TaxID=13085 RepID=UPI00292D48BF|nr:zinc finger protein 185 [Heteronotia binoei]
MLSLSALKDGTVVPSEEDRKKILTQMKVKTTLRSDKSWIQKKSDSEEEKNHSPLHSPLRSRKTIEGSPVSPKVSPLNHRAVFEELSSQAEQQFPVASKPSKKSHNTTASSGYLIRGVFTKTVDKSAPANTVSNGSQKCAKSASPAPGYKMSTEDYKRLAPYNVKRDAGPDYVDPPVSPDEQQKRTEAASSVLRQSARKERSYVFSAAKKSNGSAAGEAPPFMAKRVEIEDDSGPRSRSQTMPASSRINGRGKSTVGERRSLWGDQRMSNVASTTSTDAGGRNQASRHSSGYSSAFSHFTSLENSNKQDQEKHNQTSWHGSPPKGIVSSPKRSEKNEGKFQPTSGSEKRDAIFSEDSWEGRKAQSAKMNQNSQVFHSSPDSSPKRYTADQEEETFSKEIKPGSLSSRITEDQPAAAQSHSLATDSTDPLLGERYSALPTTISNDQNIDSERSVSSLEEQTAQEEKHKSPSETEYEKVETHLAKSGSCSSEGNLSTAGTQTEQPEAIKSEESGMKTARSNSLSVESSVTTPGEQKSDADTGSLSRRAIFGSSGNIYRMSSNLDNLVGNRSVWESGHRTPPYLNRQTSYTGRTSCGMPSCLNCQPYNTNMSEMSHKMTPYLNNPAFSSGRAYSASRDSLVSNSLRSHRMPFYKDICDTENRRYLPRTEDRPAFASSFPTASSQFGSPSASGYDSDPTTGSKSFLFVKESINSTELSSSPRHNSRSLVDLSTLERQNYSSGNYLQNSAPRRPSEDICTYCGREIRNCPKIKIEKLNICCHEFCFRCGICHKPMGDLLDKIYIHRDIIHCDKCYEKLF